MGCSWYKLALTNFIFPWLSTARVRGISDLDGCAMIHCPIRNKHILKYNDFSYVISFIYILSSRANDFWEETYISTYTFFVQIYGIVVHLTDVLPFFQREITPMTSVLPGCMKSHFGNGVYPKRTEFALSALILSL